MKSSMFGHGLRLVAMPAALSAFAFAASSAARADDAAAADAPKKSDLDGAVQTTILRGDAVSNLYDDVQKWKKDEGIPIEIGAWHWWHANRNVSRHLQYGINGLEGTYYYYMHFDPATDNGAGTKLGAHVDLRARDSNASFRPFFDSTLWLWEGYGYVQACDMTFKAGKIWRRFGMDWDDSWYGNVAYFDGWKLDPDWGVSLERTCDFGHGVTAPSFAQVFVAQDRVNGSISGADSESDEDQRERTSIVLRTVPTWKMKDGGNAIAFMTEGKVEMTVVSDGYPVPVSGTYRVLGDKITLEPGANEWDKDLSLFLTYTCAIEGDTMTLMTPDGKATAWKKA